MTKFIMKQRKANKKKPPHSDARSNFNQWRVAVLANMFYDRLNPDDPPDKGGDYDSPETINRICEIIRKEGHTVQFIQANRSLPQRIMEFKPDICFNISEGIEGDSREAQVPGFLELLGIPYTGSRVLANGIALDKPLTKTIWAAAGLPVALSQSMFDINEPLNPGLEFPLIVKPSHEGTGMGLDPNSLVRNESQLREQVSKIIIRYRQPALVEKFLPGREFTIGIMGHPGANVRRPDFYEPDGFHRFPIVEVFAPTSEVGICDFTIKHNDTDKATVAELTSEFREQLYDLVLKGHKAIGALDISRTDVRCDENGDPYLLEINPLPGLSNGSYFTYMARFSNLSIETLVLEILHLGAERYGLEQTSAFPLRAEYPLHQVDRIRANQLSAM